MKEKTTSGGAAAAGRNSAGFALVLALLALMLLTFLGLTLATTTSTELQVASNYRWSQQAYYNAEAGLEVAKVVLRRVQDATQILPVARTSVWNEFDGGPFVPTGPTTTAIATRATRNFENWRCDNRGWGVGYGTVVDDGAVGSPYENVRSIFGNTLQGAFTIWVRRTLVPAPRPPNPPPFNSTDNLANDTVIVTVEGVAPFPNSPNRAVRVLESTMIVQPPCPSGDNQASATGGSPCTQH